MSNEESLKKVRQEKHQLLNGGTYPLATNADSISQVLSWLVLEPVPISLVPSELECKVVVHGRITNIRKSGGITFIKIFDQSGSIQLIASKTVLGNYGDLPLLDLGDIIEVSGLGCRSKTLELSVLIQSWKVLTKSHLPHPDKFWGLADEEVKCRQRYLDLLSSEETRARFVTRSVIIRLMREYLINANFLEVETSTLSAITSGANAKPFTTFHNYLEIPLNLRIAPELNLKRLLVGGFDKVFEIGKNYRNEGISARHNPEFTMMESYQAYGSFPELIDNTVNLLTHVIDEIEFQLPENMTAIFKGWQEDSPVNWDNYQVITMAETIARSATLSEIEVSDSFEIQILNPNNERLLKVKTEEMVSVLAQATSPGQRQGVLFEYLVEPFLTEDYRTTDKKKSIPVFITEYPKDLSPLARASDQNPNVCDRFELFVNGIELANAFQELNDPVEQSLRFQQQLESNQKDPMSFDSDYIRALEYGMPPAIGFGIGIDRLCAILTNTSSIKDVILFPTLRPI